jgi:hypothetical protein
VVESHAGVVVGPVVQAVKFANQRRAWARSANRSGYSGRYLAVLKLASLNGLNQTVNYTRSRR